MKRFSYINILSVLVFLSLFGSSCTLTLCTRPEYVVTRNDDVAGGLCSATNCTLRQAVFASNVCSGEQVIRIPEGTYALTVTGRNEDANATGDLDIIDGVRIIGSGMPVIDGYASDRVFDIQAGTTVDMSGIVIQNGLIPVGFEGSGGGIRNKGNLTATNLLIRDNTGSPVGTSGAGGFVNMTGGTARISYSAIISNYTEEGAGGVANFGEMTLDNVTISGNDAYGIYHAGGHLEISYSTITNNLPYQIQSSSGDPVVIRNSIVSGEPEWDTCRGSFISGGFNIEYASPDIDPEASCNFTGSGDLVGVDPLLQPLTAYDGVTPPFHELGPASPALDSADPSSCGGTDQRGVGRPVGTGCDRGAIEMTEIISLPELPVATAPPEFEPPELIGFILTIQVPANCRQGPGVAYPVVNSALAGEQIEVLGKSADGTWWYSKVDNDQCFISNIAGTPTGDLNSLPVIPAPPTPVPTKTEVPQQQQEQPTAVTEIDFDQDGYGVNSDCNDKNAAIHPGAVETPDDKVDSNCNGDDDK
ncbi:MAG: hypothetical protein JNM55_03180 [Anaerolineales bacterium]|nr:hypothetical protein [Anaerolineales bacterium]